MTQFWVYVKLQGKKDNLKIVRYSLRIVRESQNCEKKKELQDKKNCKIELHEKKLIARYKLKSK